MPSQPLRDFVVRDEEGHPFLKESDALSAAKRYLKAMALKVMESLV